MDKGGLSAEGSARLACELQEILTRHHVRLTDEGERFIRLYSAVVVRRASEGYPLAEFSAEDVAQNVRDAARELVGMLQQLAGKALSAGGRGVAVRAPCRPPGTGRRSGHHQRR
ncbi:Uncharacterised protein [Raoultella terrigena]|uniref:Uncharacterized protein n=1 Tax=Raoultella terrigena TaxID=577 RepID=A0A4U9D4W0_RAOTE|nr:Uncharacterised protein [Raoultella terrigena]